MQRADRVYVESDLRDGTTQVVKEHVTLAAARRFCWGKYGQRLVIRRLDGVAIETWMNDRATPGDDTERRL